MAETEALMRRIETALDTISEHAQTSAPMGDSAMAQEIDRLREEKSRLATELDELKAQRDRDVADIDALVAELKPLIGEA